MAIAIGYALHTPPLVLFSLAAVGFAANDAGGAGGPLAVLVVAVVASELGKAVSKETKVDIIVTPAVTILGGCGLALVAAPWIGALASSVGGFIMWATELQPFFMGVIVSVVIGIALTLPDLVGGHLRRPRADGARGRGRRWQGAAPRWWASPC